MKKLRFLVLAALCLPLCSCFDSCQKAVAISSGPEQARKPSGGITKTVIPVQCKEVVKTLKSKDLNYFSVLIPHCPNKDLRVEMKGSSSQALNIFLVKKKQSVPESFLNKGIFGYSITVFRSPHIKQGTQVFYKENVASALHQKNVELILLPASTKAGAPGPQVDITLEATWVEVNEPKGTRVYSEGSKAFQGEVNKEHVLPINLPFSYTKGMSLQTLVRAICTKGCGGEFIWQLSNDKGSNKRYVVTLYPSSDGTNSVSRRGNFAGFLEKDVKSLCEVTQCELTLRFKPFTKFTHFRYITYEVTEK